MNGAALLSADFCVNLYLPYAYGPDVGNYSTVLLHGWPANETIRELYTSALQQLGLYTVADCQYWLQKVQLDNDVSTI